MVFPRTASQQITLASLLISPASVVGGNPVTGTIYLTSAASSNTEVNLSSDNSSVSVPSTVLVPSGSKFAQFPISTLAVAASANITAFYKGVSKTSLLSVTSSQMTALASVSINPTNVIGGNSSVGKVTLTTAAPSSGLTVALWTSGSPAFVPNSLIIPAGEISGTFAVSTNYVSKSTQGIITGFYNGVAKNTVITVTPEVSITLASLSVNNARIRSGASATGVVVLSGAAPAGGAVVDLWTNGSPAFVPTSLLIPAGATRGMFPITTNWVFNPTQGTITAVYNGAKKTTTVTVSP